MFALGHARNKKERVRRSVATFAEHTLLAACVAAVSLAPSAFVIGRPGVFADPALVEVRAVLRAATAACPTGQPTPALEIVDRRPHWGWWESSRPTVISVNPRRTPPSRVLWVVAHEAGHWCQWTLGRRQSEAWADRYAWMVIAGGRGQHRDNSA